MKRTLIAGIAALSLLGFSAAAGASTLTMTADQAVYTTGDTITLTFEATTTGTELAGTQVRVITNWTSGDGGSVNEVGAPSAADTFTQFGVADFTVGTQQGNCEWALGREDQCLVWDQLSVSAAAPVDAGVFTATMEFTADAIGTVDFAFQDGIGSDFVFFELSDASGTGGTPAGTSVTIVPEPTTAALLGLGLFGLALGGRRR